MNKKVGIGIGTLTVAAIIGLGVYQSSAATANPKLSSDEIRELVNAEYSGTITEFELEKELDNAVYEVEVLSDGKEYDLKLDGDTGEVLKSNEREVANKQETVAKNDDNVDDQGENATGNTKNTSNKDVISMEKAEEIALNEFAGTIKELELDEDDERLVYEVEIKNENQEADIEIDAYSGDVIELDIDTEQDDD